MIPLGQFRDTFIIAVDDEGVAIIDQHVAHERVLFEQISERLTTGRLESQRLLTPMLIDLSPAQRQALGGAPGDARSVRAWRSRSSAETACGSSAVPAAARSVGVRGDGSGAGRGPRGLRSRVAGRGGAPADSRDHGVPRRGQGELPVDDYPDAIHPGGASQDGVLERLSAWPACGAPVVEPGDREEFSPYLRVERGLKGGICP